MKTVDAISFVEKVVALPQGMALVEHEMVAHDKRSVMRFRFVKQDQKNALGDAHFSVTIDPEDQRLMGLMHLDKCFDADNYVDEETAKATAFEFLASHAPDLLDTVEVRWIRPTRKIPLSPPHDEGFKLNDGTIITGMRVKLWANDVKKYAWVIVNAQGDVISFERDIVWSTLKRCRTTEKWLHDDWLKAQLEKREK